MVRKGGRKTINKTKKNSMKGGVAMKGQLAQRRLIREAFGEELKQRKLKKAQDEYDKMRKEIEETRRDRQKEKERELQNEYSDAKKRPIEEKRENEDSDDSFQSVNEEEPSDSFESVESVEEQQQPSPVFEDPHSPIDLPTEPSPEPSPKPSPEQPIESYVYVDEEKNLPKKMYIIKSRGNYSMVIYSICEEATQFKAGTDIFLDKHSPSVAYQAYYQLFANEDKKSRTLPNCNNFKLTLPRENIDEHVQEYSQDLQYLLKQEEGCYIFLSLGKDLTHNLIRSYQCLTTRIREFPDILRLAGRVISQSAKDVIENLETDFVKNQKMLKKIKSDLIKRGEKLDNFIITTVDEYYTKKIAEVSRTLTEHSNEDQIEEVIKKTDSIYNEKDNIVEWILHMKKHNKTIDELIEIVNFEKKNNSGDKKNLSDMLDMLNILKKRFPGITELSKIPCEKPCMDVIWSWSPTSKNHVLTLRIYTQRKIIDWPFEFERVKVKNPLQFATKKFDRKKHNRKKKSKKPKKYTEHDKYDKHDILNKSKKTNKHIKKKKHKKKKHTRKKKKKKSSQ